jgi:hypothetical protein
MRVIACVYVSMNIYKYKYKYIYIIYTYACIHLQIYNVDRQIYLCIYTVHNIQYTIYLVHTGSEFEIQGPHILGCLCHNQNPWKPRSEGQYIYIHLYTIYIYIFAYICIYSTHIYSYPYLYAHMYTQSCAYTHVCIRI